MAPAHVGYSDAMMSLDRTPTETAVSAALRWRRILAAAGGEDVPDLDVVFVCTGNRFRSPLAAGLFAQATLGLPVVVRSAGTLDRGSPPAFPQTLEQARRFGIDLSAHRARALAREDVTAADAVIGFEHAHVAVAVMDSSVARDRAFTLPELVELLEEVRFPVDGLDPITHARMALQQAASARSTPGWSGVRGEVADPVGRSEAVFADTADEIRDLVERLTRGLFG